MIRHAVREGNLDTLLSLPVADILQQFIVAGTERETVTQYIVGPWPSQT